MEVQLREHKENLYGLLPQLAVSDADLGGFQDRVSYLYPFRSLQGSCQTCIGVGGCLL